MEWDYIDCATVGISYSPTNIPSIASPSIDPTMITKTPTLFPISTGQQSTTPTKEPTGHLTPSPAETSSPVPPPTATTLTNSPTSSSTVSTIDYNYSSINDSTVYNFNYSFSTTSGSLTVESSTSTTTAPSIAIDTSTTQNHDDNGGSSGGTTTIRFDNDALYIIIAASVTLCLIIIGCASCNLAQWYQKQKLEIKYLQSRADAAEAENNQLKQKKKSDSGNSNYKIGEKSALMSSLTVFSNFNFHKNNKKTMSSKEMAVLSEPLIDQSGSGNINGGSYTYTYNYNYDDNYNTNINDNGEITPQLQALRVWNEEGANNDPHNQTINMYARGGNATNEAILVPGGQNKGNPKSIAKHMDIDIDNENAVNDNNGNYINDDDDKDEESDHDIESDAGGDSEEMYNNENITHMDELESSRPTVTSGRHTEKLTSSTLTSTLTEPTPNVNSG